MKVSTYRCFKVILHLHYNGDIQENMVISNALECIVFIIPALSGNLVPEKFTTKVHHKNPGRTWSLFYLGK